MAPLYTAAVAPFYSAVDRPRQMLAKTPQISAQLFGIAFSDADQFPRMAEIILPLLTVIDRDQVRLPNLGNSSDNIIDRYPHRALALLHAVLPDNVAAWPYRIEATLLGIGKADESLRLDERWLELMRKWNSR